MKSVYIHIPFCNKFCSYCDFAKSQYNDEKARKYLDILKEEIADSYLGEKINTIYIGGGTPSCLSENNLVYLFMILKKFNLTDKVEFTFECNPEDLTFKKLVLLKDNNINRLSIGVQSFNKNKLKIMGRNSKYKDIKNKIKLARSLNFDNISLDLIYSFENETLRELKKDVKKILKLKPDHISTYSLIIKEGTPLYKRNYKNQNEDIEVKMYNYIIKKLKRKKYIHYEISNFAKKGKKSKHNLVYFNNEEYYGFGLSAAGYFSGFRYTNTADFKKYLNKEFREEQTLLSKQEIMDFEIMLGFRKINGINLQEFYDKYEKNISDAYPVKPLLKRKELIYKDGNIFINQEKLYVMNEILLKMI